MSVNNTGGRPRFLVVRHVDPGKIVYGGIAYTNAILSMLREAFPDAEIDQLYVYRSLSALKSRPRKAYSVIRSLFSRLPAKAMHFVTSEFATDLRKRVSNNEYDWIILNGIDVMPYLSEIRAGHRLVYIAHNWEGELYRQQMSRFRDWPLLRTLVDRDQQKLTRLEDDGLARVDRVVFISAQDEDALRARVGELNSCVIGPTFAYPTYEPSKPTKTPRRSTIRIGFLANLDWWPNKEAIEWFHREIFRRLPQDEFQLHIFGPGSSAYGDGRSFFGHGFAEDLKEVWRSVDCMVQPILSGSGVNIKVAETLYNGIPMIGTPQSIRGLVVEKDASIAILPPDPEAWRSFIAGEKFEAFCAGRISKRNRSRFAIAEGVRKLAALLDMP